MYFTRLRILGKKLVFVSAAQESEQRSPGGTPFDPLGGGKSASRCNIEEAFMRDPCQMVLEVCRRPASTNTRAAAMRGITLLLLGKSDFACVLRQLTDQLSTIH